MQECPRTTRQRSLLIGAAEATAAKAIAAMAIGTVKAAEDPCPDSEKSRLFQSGDEPGSGTPRTCRDRSSDRSLEPEGRRLGPRQRRNMPITMRPMRATTPSTAISTSSAWLAAVANPAIEVLFDDYWRLP